jgi:hypothetical protein
MGLGEINREKVCQGSETKPMQVVVVKRYQLFFFQTVLQRHVEHPSGHCSVFF